TRILLDHAGMFGRYVPGGYLVYVSNGTLFGVRFDPESLEVKSGPVVLMEQLYDRPTGGSAALDFSQSGTAVYRNGKPSGLLTVQWLDMTGKTEMILAKPTIYLYPRISPDGGRLLYTATETSRAAAIWVHDLERDISTPLTAGGTGNMY